MGTLSVVLPPFSPRGVRGCCHPASRRSSTPHEPPAAASLLRVCVCGVMRRAVAAHAQIPTHLPGRLGRQQLACVAGGAPVRRCWRRNSRIASAGGWGASGRCVRVPVRGAAAVARVGGGPIQVCARRRWASAECARQASSLAARAASSSRGAAGHGRHTRIPWQRHPPLHGNAWAGVAH